MDRQAERYIKYIWFTLVYMHSIKIKHRYIAFIQSISKQYTNTQAYYIVHKDWQKDGQMNGWMETGKKGICIVYTSLYIYIVCIHNKHKQYTYIVYIYSIYTTRHTKQWTERQIYTAYLCIIVYLFSVYTRYKYIV